MVGPLTLALITLLAGNAGALSQEPVGAQLFNLTIHQQINIMRLNETHSRANGKRKIKFHPTNSDVLRRRETDGVPYPFAVGGVTFL